ncbi:putative transport domain protein [Burkholderia thailandensis MSMB121]|nr:putative transport domain protein [Burkholderia thailandensis MSMB121]ATF32650.1 transporter [Burkholderia thailandensis]KST71168.1 transporter [Burkholderia humptydooensis]
MAARPFFGEIASARCLDWSALLITGYAGHLVDPAGMGFVARSVGLESALWMLAALLCLVPFCDRVVTANRT